MNSYSFIYAMDKETRQIKTVNLLMPLQVNRFNEDVCVIYYLNPVTNTLYTYDGIVLPDNLKNEILLVLNETRKNNQPSLPSNVVETAQLRSVQLINQSSRTKH